MPLPHACTGVKNPSFTNRIQPFSATLFNFIDDKHIILFFFVTIFREKKTRAFCQQILECENNINERNREEMSIKKCAV